MARVHPTALRPAVSVCLGAQLNDAGVASSGWVGVDASSGDRQFVVAMALVREHAAAVYGGGGFDGGAEAAFDGFGYGQHEALLEGLDAAALLGGCGGYPAGVEPAAFLESRGNVWAGGAASPSVLAFDRAAAAEEEEECDAWIDAMDQSYGAVTAAAAAPTASVGFDATTGCFTLTERPAPGGAAAARAFGLLFPSTSTATAAAAGCPNRPAPARAPQKRTYVVQGAEPQGVSPKRQCGAGRKASKAAKAAPAIPTKDPQSLAAKNRRERISERLRTLQELVPNGTKVDLVTMLEKAISYVKFLQLQVKVLATDEFWPAQGGKAPEISQVREALDAILSSSQRAQSN
ncbi:hypothetical protein ACP4OV_000161 [Aristida adscensionis]